MQPRRLNPTIANESAQAQNCDFGRHGGVTSNGTSSVLADGPKAAWGLPAKNGALPRKVPGGIEKNPDRQNKGEIATQSGPASAEAVILDQDKPLASKSSWGLSRRHDATTDRSAAQTKVTFDNKEYRFTRWKPSMGRVFSQPFAFDCETTLIDMERPWAPPDYVLGAACDGKQGFFVQRADVDSFFACHGTTPVVFHNAPFDLAVIRSLAGMPDIYEMVEQKIVWDTQILHRLYVLGNEGHQARGKGQSDLEHCVRVYLGIELPKDVTDSRGDAVRLSYAKWLDQATEKIEAIYLEYLAKDVIATHGVYSALRERLDELLARSDNVWGFVSAEWLDTQVREWGPQTHHIQLRAAIVLKEITANGLHVDVAGHEKLASGLNGELADKDRALRDHGYIPKGRGTSKSLQAILKNLEDERGVRFPRTPTDKYSASLDSLRGLADTVPFIRLLLDYRATAKLLNSFVGKMAKPVLHPAYNVLARTGRTSSFGDINAQNLPVDDRVRSCFVPSEGHVFIDADYSTIELATLAQACIGQFGLSSAMADAINAGKDLHTLVAARVTNKGEAEVTKDERKKAKPINFGKPGGMGDAAMRKYALASYGVQLTEEEVYTLSEAWFELFPEMQEFLNDDVNTPLELAKLLDLTPDSHAQHTGDARLAWACTPYEMECPSSVLGGMCLKVLRDPTPRTRDGRLYSAGDIDYFWSQLETKQLELSERSRQAIRQRQPSAELQSEIAAVVGRSTGVFTLTGRLRGRANYTARHNTVFQGLAADGAKLGLWLLWRAGYRIVNFIHDEVLIEVSATSDLGKHAERIEQLMVAGMKQVVPDVKVEVKYAAIARWHKGAEAVHDENGKLQLWRPTESQQRKDSHTATESDENVKIAKSVMNGAA